MLPFIAILLLYSVVSSAQDSGPPTARAGSGQTVAVGSTVTLNGSASTDPHGDSLTFVWTLVSRPAGSAAALSNPNSLNPAFIADKPGRYTINLVVNDGTTNSAPDSVVISTSNSAPVANAGPDQTVGIGNTVALNGSASSDVDGNALTFAWSITSRPPGSAATILNTADVTPSFVVDTAGQYVVQLIVNDGMLNSRPDTLIINTGNSPPTADAGPNQTVAVTSPVVLNGSGSTDVDGNALTFAWSFITRPGGSTATLSNPAALMPTFTADVAGDFVVQLIVSDGIVSSAPRTVTITTTNSAPRADAGPDQRVAVGSMVSLNGSASFDPESAPLKFRWSLISQPAGSATLSNANSATPGFTADVPGTYVAQLIVSDGAFDSAPDTVIIATRKIAPVANAGSSRTVGVDSTVVLDGSASSDADSDALTYFWSFTARPTDSTAALINPTSLSPSFVVDRAGIYVVQLIVNDGTANSVPDTVVINTQNQAPVAQADPDPTAKVGKTKRLDGTRSSDPDGNRLTYDWSITSAPKGSTVKLSNATSATPSLTPDVAGAYTIRFVVNDGAVDSAADSVTLNATVEAEGPLGNGSVHTGAISTAAEVDTWTFTANAGQRIAVHIGEITDNNDFRPWIRVRAPNAAVVGSASGTDAAALNDLIAPATGTYTVLVASIDSGFNGTGSYRLTMSKTPGPIVVSGGDQGGPLTNGGTHTGQILQGDLDVWTFTAVAGERIAAHIGEITDLGGFSPWIRIWAPNNATLGSASGTDAAALTAIIAPVSGTYLILVASLDSGFDGTGTYRLSMTKTQGAITVPTGDQGGPISNGGLHTGSILQGDLDVWTFSATQGERIAVHIGQATETDDFRPWIRVWAPNGTALGWLSGTDAAALNDIIAPVSGTYLILVASEDSGFDGTGSYRLTMTKTRGLITVSTGDQGGAITSGATRAGEIIQGDLDVWTFTATAGQRIRLQINETTDTDDFRPWIRVWAPNGATLGSASGVSTAQIGGTAGVVAPVSGTYLFLVGSFDSGFDGTGTYQLTLNRAAVVPVSSCAQAAVQAAINSAQNGDTVLVPAGTCTWSSSVTISGKGITLQGAGIDRTIIRDGTANNLLSITANPAFAMTRVTGFTFDANGTTKANNAGTLTVFGSNGGGRFRLDTFKLSKVRDRGVVVAMEGTQLSGVIDSCRIEAPFNGDAHGVHIEGSEPQDGSQFNYPLNLGSANAIYVEDCTFNYAFPNDGALDAYTGSRYVFRHNTVNGTTIGHHGADSGEGRGCTGI